MGKSKVDVLSSHNINLKMPQQGFYIPDLTQQTANNTNEEDEHLTIQQKKHVTAFQNQVSGHMNLAENIGFLSCNGKLLKTVAKRYSFDRESDFYASLTNTNDDSLAELRNLVPKYYGIETIQINEKKVDCIVLEDLTKDMKEPCIMDIKIGKRTWDPMASYEKIMKEEQKYHPTKRDFGFCITGFQVYKLSNGKLNKFGKEFGKKLDKDNIVDAFRTFLNANDVGLSRPLLVQLLAALWRIQNWARKQRRVKLYSSSILIMYDARKLKQSMDDYLPAEPPKKPLMRSNSLYRPLSLAVLNGNENEKIPTGFSGQLTQEGPILKSTPRVLTSLPQQVSTSNGKLEKKERKKSLTSIPTLKRVHSFQNNFDKDLQTMKQNYTYMLDDLVSDQKNDIWASVKLIDFAHAFPNNSNEVDTNYLEGIDNLVKIFEQFLAETDYRP